MTGYESLLQTVLYKLWLANGFALTKNLQIVLPSSKK